MSPREKLVLFVCTENRFRSQIAEAYFNAYAPPGWRAVSAGSRPAPSLHPNAVRLMLEEGIDISAKKPKHLTPDLEAAAEIGVIVCGESDEGSCPVVRTRYVEQWEIPDPARLSLEEARRWRDEIKRKVLDLIERIRRGDVPPQADFLSLRL